MNFVKYFNVLDYGGYPKTFDFINAFAKENGCEPISVSLVGNFLAVVYHPIDFSNQTGRKE